MARAADSSSGGVSWFTRRPAPTRWYSDGRETIRTLQPTMQQPPRHLFLLLLLLLLLFRLLLCPAYRRCRRCHLTCTRWWHRRWVRCRRPMGRRRMTMSISSLPPPPPPPASPRCRRCCRSDRTFIHLISLGHPRNPWVWIRLGLSRPHLSVPLRYRVERREGKCLLTRADVVQRATRGVCDIGSTEHTRVDQCDGPDTHTLSPQQRLGPEPMAGAGGVQSGHIAAAAAAAAAAQCGAGQRHGGAGCGDRGAGGVARGDGGAVSPHTQRLQL